MRGNSSFLLQIVLIVSLHFNTITADTGPHTQVQTQFQEQVFNFGHVGIDFIVYHTFYLVNQTKEPIRIIKATPSCNCIGVTTLDSIVNPGDTAFFRMKFNSKDFYGPTNKSFTVSTDHPSMPEVKFSFLSQVGQWFAGIKPDPISLFFLPKHRAKKITIKNTMYDEISVTVQEQFSNDFDITLLKDKASKGQALELEVVPRTDSGRGTYTSSFTLAVEKKGDSKPTILTIPIKIVRY